MSLLLKITRGGKTYSVDLTPFIYGTKSENEWEESKHPRDKDGKFSETGGDSVGGQRKEDFLEKEYTGVKGKDAIDKLMKEKQGFVRDAFSRKDIGNIALIWGNNGMGLAHIIKRRKETKQPLGKLLSSLTEVIENGELEEQANGRFGLRYKGKVAVIEPKLLGKEISFLFTAFYEQ